ncbi:hypothetical protein E4U17_004236 [Claviceps sp. LM77 group G4]|nr:hypothetical protein E4U17_004236 [Claviceps sp. LM77 group G4]KAG6080960.1 hypothetical protein E4U16_007982 [Claviceps sp. LM84 group G4]KAG6086323.1 hypothetical protein E4U33_006142 [Claviceps sp. LM78 group G4]
MAFGQAEGGERDKEDEASEDNERYHGEEVGAIVAGELKMYDARRLDTAWQCLPFLAPSESSELDD